jgi:hypothetical protein
MCDLTGPTPVQLSLRLADERGDGFEALVWGGLIENLIRARRDLGAGGRPWRHRMGDQLA